jgi:hypothetical protein
MPWSPCALAADKALQPFLNACNHWCAFNKKAIIAMAFLFMQFQTF